MKRFADTLYTMLMLDNPFLLTLNTEEQNNSTQDDENDETLYNRILSKVCKHILTLDNKNAIIQHLEQHKTHLNSTDSQNNGLFFILSYTCMQREFSASVYLDILYDCQAQLGINMEHLILHTNNNKRNGIEELLAQYSSTESDNTAYQIHMGITDILSHLRAKEYTTEFCEELLSHSVNNDENNMLSKLHRQFTPKHYDFLLNNIGIVDMQKILDNNKSINSENLSLAECNAYLLEDANTSNDQKIILQEWDEKRLHIQEDDNTKVEDKQEQQNHDNKEEVADIITEEKKDTQEYLNKNDAKINEHTTLKTDAVISNITAKIRDSVFTNQEDEAAIIFQTLSKAIERINTNKPEQYDAFIEWLDSSEHSLTQCIGSYTSYTKNTGLMHIFYDHSKGAKEKGWFNLNKIGYALTGTVYLRDTLCDDEQFTKTLQNHLLLNYQAELAAIEILKTMNEDKLNAISHTKKILDDLLKPFAEHTQLAHDIASVIANDIHNNLGKVSLEHPSNTAEQTNLAELKSALNSLNKAMIWGKIIPLYGTTTKTDAVDCIFDESAVEEISLTGNTTPNLETQEHDSAPTKIT